MPISESDPTGVSRVPADIAKTFGTRVRQLRLAKGFSQVEFGEKCGFYQTYLSRIENGQANPSLNAIEVLANALDMTIFELFAAVEAGETEA